MPDFKEKAQSLKRRVLGAMVYPVVVILVAIIIVTGIMVFIIPKFEKIFKDFNLDLPWPTQMLMATSRPGSPTTGSCCRYSPCVGG